MQAAFRKWGDSQGIIIPKPVLEIVGIEENESVDVTVEDGAIVIRKRPRAATTIQEIFGEFAGQDEAGEIDWGPACGNEVW